MEEPCRVRSILVETSCKCDAATTTVSDVLETRSSKNSVNLVSKIRDEKEKDISSSYSCKNSVNLVESSPNLFLSHAASFPSKFHLFLYFFLDNLNITSMSNYPYFHDPALQRNATLNLVLNYTYGLAFSLDKDIRRVKQEMLRYAKRNLARISLML